MLRTKSMRWAATSAFVFGLAFSLSAFGSSTCQRCWDSCQTRYDRCIASGENQSTCGYNYRQCAIGCRCQIP
ncbi:hypothetical protein [Lysobacter sp. CA199]|uniref:hypothetical protein n=1 Tax=Lysobacter sp. CA199 TaxID=3455608 RepID=UPI003F8D3E5F